MNSPILKPTNRVKIIGLSNGQHHENIGDGELLLLNKEATVKSINEEKIFVTIDGYDYVLWFIRKDLELL